MAQRFSQTDLDLMDQIWSDLSPRTPAHGDDSFIPRNALQTNPTPPPMEPASMVEPGAPSRPLGADEVAELGDRDYPELQPQPRYRPAWPGPIENFMPRRQFAANAAQAPTQMEPPTDVYGKPITSDNPFEPEYHNILKREREAEFKDRGFLRGVASDVVGGLVDYGELGLRGVRTLAPKGSALEEAATSGIERINRFKEETPFFQQDPNAGYLSRSIHGGIRSAFQSMAAGLPTAAAGIALGSTLGPAGAAIGGLLGWSFGGKTQFGLAQYDDVMERGKPLVEQGKLSYEELQSSAIRQALYEGGFEIASDLLGGWMMGVGKLLAAPAKQALQATIRDMTKVGFKEFAKRAAGLTAAETSTEMVTQALQSEEDYRLGLGNQRFWEGAIDAFGPSVVASMIFAGLGHANVKLAQRSVLKSLENPEADPKKRSAAVDAVYAALEQDHPVVASIWAQTASNAIDQKLPISTDENIMDSEARLNEARLNEPQRLLPPGQGFIMREPGEVYAPYSPEFAEARIAAGERGLPAPTPREPVQEQPELTVEQLDTRIKNLSKMEKSIATQIGKAKTDDRREKLNQRLTDLQAQIQANKEQREALLERVGQEAANQQREADRQAKILSGLPNQPLPTDMADLELEQQYLDSVRRSAPAGDNLVDLEAVAKREQQIQTAIDAEEIYRQRFERTKLLDRRVANLEKIPNPSEKQKQNLESFKQERSELQDYEDQATKLGIRFIGMQMQAHADLPPIPLFNDNNGATFTIMEGESLEDALKRKRGDFAVKEEEVAISIDEAAHEAATSPKNDLPEPTQAQKEAGNYKLGHIDFQGLDISIENPRGSTRKGVSPEGKPWETELTHHYGYLKGTVGRDKDHLDTFIGPEVESDRVFVVDQTDPKTGKFDEHKVMLGFTNQDEARQGYLSNYEKGWKGLGAMTEMSMDEFKTWAKSDKTKKPVAELGKEVPHDREGEGGVAGPLGEGKEPGGAIQIEVPGGKETGAGGILQEPEGGEGEVVPGPEGITIETPEAAGPAAGRFEVRSVVKWTDRKGIEHTGIIQQWFRNTANIKDEGGKIYAVKRDKLTLVAPPAAGPIVTKEPEKPAKESIEAPAVTPPKMEEQGTEPVSMGQETAEKKEREEGAATEEKPVEPSQPKGAADQIREMSMDQLDEILDAGEKAAISAETGVSPEGEKPPAGETTSTEEPKPPPVPEATPAPEQEAPAEITIEPAPVGGPRAPKGARQPRAKRTAADIAKSAAEHGVKGIEEAVSGLYELFGGKALRSFPGGIDEDTYQKAKPHFQKALEEFQAAGKDVKAFVKWAYDSFSSKIKPYLRRFIQEMKKIKPESPAEVEMEEGGGDGITIETEGEEGAGKKKRTKKLLDTGEKLGGKRSSKDHRERSEAIEIELNGDTSDVPPKALAEFLIEKTTRSKYLKVDHGVEGRTPGTGRFLNTFRSLISTWPDWYKREMGARRNRNAFEVLERQLSGGWAGDAEEALKNQAEAKKSAAEYISTMEQLNDAVSSAVTVGEARQNIMKLLVGEEQADKWLIEEDQGQVRSDFSYAMNSSAIASDESILTDTGKSLGKFLGRKWDFAHFMITGWEAFAETELAEDRNKPIVRQRRNIFEITTPDTYRNGRDVTPEELLEVFALRGLDFGEWVEADFRQRSVNLTYDSFKMLAEALGANDKGISLSDATRLGIGWGARGRGGRTAAEFYPDNKVIALTKTKGDGSLAHEWAHAFDYMTERENFWADAAGRYVNAIADIKLALGTFYNVADLENMVMDLLRGVWHQARSRTGRLKEAKKFLKDEAIDHLQKQTKFESDAIMLDHGERGKYYSKSEEMFARAFEAYVSDQLQGANTYLVDADFVAPGAVEIMFNREHGAYPSEKERERFNRIFDDFFSQIEWSKDGIPKLKPDYVPVTTLERRRAQEAIDAMMERIDKIYEALYGGEQSDDGLYWYAYEQTGRGVAAQPKGYMAYDDSYDLKKELEATGESSEGMVGKGAVAYTDPLKADEVMMYFLKPIQYNEADTKITLEVPDGTITDLGHRGPAALEEAPPENVRPPGETGAPGAGGPGRPGEVGGGNLGPAAGGDTDRTGEGDDTAEVSLSPVGGGGTDIASGSDAFQPALRIDYTIRASSGLEQTNQTERFNNNIAAIRTLKQIEAEGRLATAEEQAILVKYSGWGELSEALSSYPSDIWKGRAEIVASVLSEDEIRAIRRSSLDAYYTAPTVAHNIYEGLQRMGFSGGKVLEPSCGVGHFFGTMPENIRRNSTLTGVDIDGISARITGQLYQNANVLHQPFEETQIPDNFYDLTISNVPFGDSSPYDKKHNPDHWRIHDYFINKMIAITKPGGLIVAITSTGTMDKHSQDARKKYAENADLLGAVRLPNGIFPGALAGADILYLRKKGEGLVPVPDLGDWVGTTVKKMPAVNTNGTAKGYDDEVTINKFFLGNPDRVIGSMAVGYNQYGGARVQVTRRDDFAEKLTEAIDKLPTSIYSTAFVPSEINILDMIPEESDLKDFNYYVGDDGKIYQAQVGNPKLIDDLTADQTDKIKRLIGMRGIIRTLLRAQASDRPTNELDALRKKLRERYDAFFKKHGAINLRANQSLLKQDPDAGLLFSLENWDRDTKTVKSLADIFTRNTVAKVTPPTSAETSEESLVYSLMWRGRVDLPYMSTLTGRTQDTLVNELKGKIYDDPEKGYVTSDEYLSGNVRKKLATARAAAELDPKYRENVEALEIALPVDLPMEDIRARLGAAWVPADVVTRFVANLFGGYLDGFHLDHVVQTGLWTPHFRGRTKAQAKRYEQFAREHSVASNEYGVTDERGRNRINLFKVGHERGLLDFALNGGFPTITDTVRYMDGTEREVLNIQLTDAANAKVDALQARFSAWISESEEVSKELREIYNERFNSFVERQYDGSHLTFPGKVPDELIKLRPHQKNAVWRFLQSGATYLAHEVGTGKTFTMIASIMEAKRMGLARKAVMATKKSNMEQIAADFLKLYPGANILVMKIPENAEKRKRIFARIATGNYDCIIVNHDSFKKIPLSIETQREIISREVQNYERALEEATMANASRHTVRDIQKRINKLREKLKKLADMERDDVPTVEEMGLDMIVVDESHTHKNIGFQTKYGDIKGVEADGSDIAFDLFMKTQYLHARNGRGILFASGTPLTNSVGELFNISRYLHPRELERFGIATFDAWANTFGVMKKEAEYAPEGGGFKLTSRFAEFVNIPELMALMRQQMDIRTAEELGIPRPDLIGGKPTAVDLEQNEFVQEFQEILKQRVRNYRASPKHATYLGRPDNMLRIVNDGRLVAMDPRLYDPSAQDYAESKSNVCVDKVWELYQKPVAAIDRDSTSKTFGKPYKEKNHLQLIFADRGVPGGRGFNLYADIKKKLVAKGVPAEQIAFAHDYPTDDQKAELYKKARAGEIRVLLGSTGLMGIGVNVQDRVSFLHHLDVDWTYANYEQRNGRGWRFGNRVQEIGIFNYGVKKTVDAFMWSTVAYKEKILQQVMSNDPKVRSVQDVSKTSAEASEMEALLSDDPLHKEKIELEAEVRRLSNIKSEYETSRRRAREKLARAPLEIQAAEKAVANNHLHMQIAEAITAFKVGNVPGLLPRDQGIFFDLEKDGGRANNAVSDILKKIKFDNEKQVAMLGRFGKIVSEEITVREKDAKTGKEIEKKKMVKRFYPLSGSLYGKDKGGLVFHIGKDIKHDYQLANGIKRGLTTIQNGLKANIKEKLTVARSLREEVPKLEKLVATSWDKEVELAEKDRRLRQVTEELLRRQDAEDARARAEQEQRQAQQQAQGEIVVEPEEEEGGRQDFSLLSETESRGGLDRQAIESRITPLISKWTNAPAGGVRVVQSRKELPARIVERAHGKEIEGVYDPGTASVWLVADNLPSLERAEEVLAHEVYGHFGLEAFLGKKKADAFLAEVAMLYGKEGLKAIAEQHGFDLSTKEGRLKAAGEKLARMAENGERPGLLRRIYAAIRAALREAGFKIKLDDADLQRLLTRSREWVEGGQARQGVSETRPLSFSDFKEGKVDPEILFSLSSRDLLDKLQSKLEGTPKTAINVIFGKETDLGELAASFGIPAWLGKGNATVRGFQERQDRRDKDRSKIIHDYLRDTEALYNLSDKDQVEFDKLAFELDGDKVVDLPKFKKTGTRELIKGPQREIIKVPVYELNEKHYQALDDYLKKEKKVPENIRAAYMAARRALDKSLIQTYERLQEIQKLDPNLIEEYRNQMGQIENYWPHVREGNYHIRVVDPKADPKTEEPVKYREDFTAAGERHARFWYAKNIDRIAAEVKKDNAGIDLKSLEWTVERNKDMPEEVYDFPIAIDAMQMVADAAVDKMPEEAGIKAQLRKEFSQEISNVLKSRGHGAHFIKRRDIPGYQKTNAAKVLYNHFAGFSGWLTKMEAAHDYGDMLREIQAREHPGEYRWAVRYVHDMLQNQTRIDRAVDNAKALFFMKYLGLGIKTMAVNLTQNLVVGMPRLSMDIGIAGAGRQFAKAVRDIRLDITEKRIEEAKGRLSDEEKRLLGDMFAEGWGQSQFLHEIRGKVGGKTGKVLGKVARVMGYPMEMSEKYNRLSLGLSAFRAAREGTITTTKTLDALGLKKGEKASYDVAKAFAETVVKDSHFVFGQGNRPQFMRGTAGGKALSAVFTFRTFSYNQLSLWRWMLASGDKEGKKAFAYSLLSMIMLGGLSAIPLYNSLAALIREIFGEDLLGNGVRKQLPPGMRDLVMYGGPSLVGVNIGGSIGMELPVIDRLNVNKSISGQLGEGIGSLLGIPYSMFDEMTKAVDAIKSGRPDRAAETVAPNFLKNIMSAERLYREGQTTITGKPINVPGERFPRKLSEGEAIGKALGFQPVSSTKAFEIYKSLEQLKSYRDEKQSELANRYVAAMRQNDQKEMVTVRNEAREWNRAAVVEGRRDMRIDLQKAIQSRQKARQPMKQMRGLAKEYRENYGM